MTFPPRKKRWTDEPSAARVKAVGETYPTAAWVMAYGTAVIAQLSVACAKRPFTVTSARPISLRACA